MSQQASRLQSVETAKQGSIVQSIVGQIQLRWLGLLRSILHLWVRSKVFPEPISNAGLKNEVQICYIMDVYALSSLLILDKACENNQLPRPLAFLDNGNRGWASLRTLRGIFIKRFSTRRSSSVLTSLSRYALEHPEFEVQLVPVSVLVGRAPDTEGSVTKIIFTEGWEVGGVIRRLLGTVINGRSTCVYYGKPLSLRELVDEHSDPGKAVRKISRLARTRLRKTRELAIGPDLSHRRTLVNKVLDSDRVRRAIANRAQTENLEPALVRRQAERSVQEIAANYSYAVIRVSSVLLGWFWNKIYRGVVLNHFETFEDAARDMEVIYVPCHRSHIDYLLVSYFLYHRGHVPPHIAAGINLNLPVLGPFLRGAGAFFMRRSFRSDPLYSVIFDEYLALILNKGVSIEYFIEGTRSRTGRLLPPRGGMLQMTVRAFLRSPSKPIMFQPIYVGYEQLAEASSYHSELSGKEKHSESLRDLFGIFKIMRHNHGQVHVNFGEPVLLDELLQYHAPQWRERTGDEKSDWLIPLVDELANAIMTNINGAADVNPINLLAISLLATSKHALPEDELVHQLALYLEILRRTAPSDRMTLTPLSPAEIITYGMELGVVQRRIHRLGNIIAVEPQSAVLLTYFRNNIAHLFAVPAFVASCFQIRSQMSLVRLTSLFEKIYPYLKSELFLPWETTGVGQELLRVVEVLKSLRLVSGSRNLRCAHGGSPAAASLHLLGRSLLQTFERYFITVAILVKNGSGQLSASELEQLCILAAQRISLLHEFEAPEFYDKTLFRQFIGNLRKWGVLQHDDTDKLVFDKVLEEVSKDAKLVMSRELRHGIIQVASVNLGEADSQLG
ncbi:MAG: glycerol-3-phosphate 1-O-acyltransferase PlsB [Halieaceae bacterium]|jgi:glycerol-3-phosphate O-acyltransferase|nr:glycerol-3-phosphate 1-O-acyltransferase PlsB [Halieaceae bacterium]